MAAKKTEELPKIPLNTTVEVFKFNGDRVAKKTMTYGEYVNIKKQPGWRYQAYEPGLCTIPVTE